MLYTPTGDSVFDQASRETRKSVTIRWRMEDKIKFRIQIPDFYDEMNIQESST